MMNQNQTQQTETGRTIVEYETNNEAGRAEIRTPTHEGENASFARLMEGDSELHQRIMAEAEEKDIPTDIIDLPVMMTPQHDDEGQMYVTDLNNVIRYYIGSSAAGQGQLVPTDDFIQNAQVVQSNERTNSFGNIYNVV